MARKPRVDESRVSGGYCALPWDVIDSTAYQSLSYPAVALLIELARQRQGGDNGRYLLSLRYLSGRGWRSKDVIERARKELLDAKLIYQTVQGHRPSKASWYALTWYSLDKIPGYDAGAAEGFRRGMYTSFQPSTPAPTREALFEKWRGHGKKTPVKINMLSPADGVERAATAPAGGVESLSTAPAGGAVRSLLPPRSTPANGHPLDLPFCTGSLSAGFGQAGAATTTTAPTARAAPDGKVYDFADDGGQIERVRDGDLDPAMYNPDTGEFCAIPTAPARHQRQAADAWVKTTLTQKMGQVPFFKTTPTTKVS